MHWLREYLWFSIAHNSGTMSSHSTCMAVTLAFSSTCNAIPRNSMIMHGIPIAFPWQTPRFARLLSSLVIDSLWSNSKRTGVRLACPCALPKVTSLFVLHVTLSSRLGMAKDIRRFGAKGPAMGMLMGGCYPSNTPVRPRDSSARGQSKRRRYECARQSLGIPYAISIERLGIFFL